MPMLETGDDFWDKILAVNLRGVFAGGSPPPSRSCAVARAAWTRSTMMEGGAVLRFGT
jgi:hypothetical protein